MKCPHCATAFHESWNRSKLGEGPDGVYVADSLICPECSRMVVQLRRLLANTTQETHTVWPHGFVRPVPPEVEGRFAADFSEASATLPVSPKASAALSRRCLQDLLREKAGVKPSNLDSEIQEVIDSGKVPSWLEQNLDAVRVVGNFAAHPIKSTHTGEVVDVEPGEAEFLLDVLDGLFDFYFVLPAKSEQRREAINAKLDEAGKPPLKA